MSANACTRLGDRHAKNPKRARLLWTKACKARDGQACVRLAELSADREHVADGYTNHACAYGVVSACNMLGTGYMLAALAPRSGDDIASRLELAASKYSRACSLGSWFGCGRAAVVIRRHNDKGRVRESRSLAHKAHSLATVACSGDDGDACDFLTAWALRAGDDSAAKAHAARACRFVLNDAPPSSLEERLRGPICLQALKLGAPIGKFYAEAKRLLPARTANLVEAKRVRGKTRVVPGQRSKLLLARKSIRRLDATLRVCLSARGYVSDVRIRRSSRVAPYDRLLFDAARRWRYRSQKVDGKPTATCMSVAFIYHQHSR